MKKQVAAAAAIFRPLRNKSFRRVWIGTTTSYLGDGAFFVALAWQVYAISGSPSAYSLIGVVWFLPQVLVLPLAGAFLDRLDHRYVFIVGDLVRAASLAVLGALSLSDRLEIWQLTALVGIYGAAEAISGPALSTLMPDIVERDDLLDANALKQFTRPVVFRLAGPLLGGWLIAATGVGFAFVLDAVTFIVSAIAVATLPKPTVAAGTGVLAPQGLRSLAHDVRAGWRYVRRRRWIWCTLVASAVGLLAFYGPFQVIIPLLVKDDLAGGADDLGIVYAFGGVGAVVAAVVTSSRGLGSRPLKMVYWTWGVGILCVAIFGLSTATWHLYLANFLASACVTAGVILWETLLQRMVASELLGRVVSFDWLVSYSLIPISFIVTGPVAALIGMRPTLLVAGVAGAVGILAFLALRPEQDLPTVEETTEPAGDRQGG